MHFNDPYVPSELRQALDANRAADDPIIVISPDIETGLRARASRMISAVRPTARWLGGVATGILIAVVAGLIVVWVHGG